MHPLFVVVLLSAKALFAEAAQAQSSYENPVDKKTYVTPGEFKTYRPAVARDTTGQRVTTEGVILLTGEPDLKMRTTVQDLAAFLKLAEQRAYPQLAKNKAASEVLVQFTCEPKQCKIQIASSGQAEESVLQAVYESLAALPPPCRQG